MLHVDDFIDNESNPSVARKFLNYKRMPVVMQLKKREEIDRLKLFCTYEGTRYRVTGASRLGDVWLTTDMQKTVGYQKRVDVAKCTEFSETIK